MIVCSHSASRSGRQAPSASRAGRAGGAPPPESVSGVPPVPPEDRAVPRCPVVGTCGGCPWQPISYAAQLRLKRARLMGEIRTCTALRGLHVGEVQPVAGEPYGYRTKLQMPVGGRAGALELGFFMPHRKELVPVENCPVQHPEGNRILREAREILERAAIPPYDERRGHGTLRYLLLRIDGSGRRAALTLVCKTDRIPRRAELAAALLRIRGVVSVALNVQPAASNVVLGPRTFRLAGLQRVLVEVCGLRFLLSPQTFFQTSAAGTEALVATVLGLLEGPVGTLYDLYGGVGLFGRALADRAGRVVIVEESPAAVADAEASLRLQAPRAPVELVRSPVEAFLRRFRLGRRPPGSEGTSGPGDAVVLDPPRAGAGEAAVRAIAERLAPARVLYVSCNPEALVRDLGTFAALGYQTHAIEPIDMFPHTPHLECVALLTRGLP